MNKEKWCLVAGISSYEKDGKKSYTVQLIGQFSEQEKEAGAIGYKGFYEWTRTDLGFLKPGDVITPIYDKGYQDKAVLGDVVVHKDLKDSPFGDLSSYLAGVPFVDKQEESAKAKK